MLALRLARGSHPLAALRRALLLCASAGAGFLLLAALGHALAHPRQPGASAVRVLWCLVPLAVTAGLAAVLGRTDPGCASRPGLDSAGLGPARLPLLAAVATALPCAVGSVLALLTQWSLHGRVPGLFLPGTGPEHPVLGQPLPVPAALTLLSAVPLTAAAASAFAARRSATAATARSTAGRSATARSTGEQPPEARWARPVACGSAAVAAGLALAAHTGGSLPRPLPYGETGAVPLLAGWAATALGLVLAGPGLVHLCGTLLTTGRPGVVRLLAGRALRHEAPRTGRPLGALCATAAAVVAAARVHTAAPGAHTVPAPAPLTGLGAALVLCCMTVGALTALAEHRRTRVSVTALLSTLGAPRELLGRVGALRTVTLSAALAPAAWAVGGLVALPLL